MQYAGGGLDVFNALAYGMPTQSDIEFFNQNKMDFERNLNPNNVGFFQSIADQFKVLDYDKLKQYTRMISKKISSFWEVDISIRALTTLEEIQFASPNMIRWVMANPHVREMYFNKLVAGYDDKYTDVEPGLIGHDHHDYRMVMHGMETWDDELEEYVFVNYDELHDDPELSVDKLDMLERCDIIETWAVTSKYLDAMKEDPTSQYSGML